MLLLLFRASLLSLPFNRVYRALHPAAQSSVQSALYFFCLQFDVDSSIVTSVLDLSAEFASFGPLKQILVDPRGQRLVCCFEHCNLLPLFRIEREIHFSFMSFFVFRLIARGFLSNPIRSNSVSELAFAPWEEKGSLLSVVWSSGHLLFYHLFYCTVSFNKQIDAKLADYLRCQNFFPILYPSKHTPKMHIENCIRLHCQRHSVLCLVRSTCQNVALTLQFAHRSQTHLFCFKDSSGRILNCAVLSNN